MDVYNYDESGFFIGATPARIDPLESSKSSNPVYLCPANATFAVPPVPEDGQRIRWNSGQWVVEVVPPVSESPDPPVAEVDPNEIAYEQLIATTLRQMALDKLSAAGSLSEYAAYAAKDGVTVNVSPLK